MISKELEYVKKYNKDYYTKNKVQISQKGKTKIQCIECNCVIRKENIHKHRLTKKHIKNEIK